MAKSLGDEVYDRELVRTLCAEIANENDPKRSEELIALLKTVLRDQLEEIRLRASYLAKRKPASSGTTAAD